MISKPVLLVPYDSKKISIAESIKEEDKEQEEGYYLENSYIGSKKEFLVLEQFLYDYERYPFPFRYSNEGATEDIAHIKAIEAVIELKYCSYKYALFIRYSLGVFIGDLEEEAHKFEHFGDYELLYKYIGNKLLSYIT